MIPPFVDGMLPPGVHRATWIEVWEAFGWTRRRQRLLRGARSVLVHLRVAGCGRAWLGGSMVTAKYEPDDFDLIWDPDGVRLGDLDPVLVHDLDRPRLAQHLKYGGDILPNVFETDAGTPFLDFMQQDEETGVRRGIVEIAMEALDDQE